MESALDGEVFQWDYDSVATLLRDVGVDNGRADIRMPQQGLDDSNVRAPSQKMSGEAVPERMRTDPLVDSRLSDGLGDGFIDEIRVEVLAAHVAGARVGGPMGGGEDVLPSPIPVGVWVLARQGVREIHLSIALLQIPPMNCLRAYEVVLQRLYEFLGVCLGAVLISLAVAHREGLHLQVQVLDPKSEAFRDAQVRSVQVLNDKLMYSKHQYDHAGRLLEGQDDGNLGPPPCTVSVDLSSQRLLEQMLVEGNKSIGDYVGKCRSALTRGAASAGNLAHCHGPGEGLDRLLERRPDPHVLLKFRLRRLVRRGHHVHDAECRKRHGGFGTFLHNPQSIHGPFLGEGSYLKISGQASEECFDFPGLASRPGPACCGNGLGA